MAGIRRHFFIWFVLQMFLFTLAIDSVHAGEFYGGYDTGAIAVQTADILVDKGLITREDAAALDQAETAGGFDPMTSGPQVIEGYQKLGQILVRKGTISEGDLAAVMQRAVESGGLKINGVNLLILETGLLKALADSGVITITEAQVLLDRAR